jgi:chromosome segregation ATPase
MTRGDMCRNILIGALTGSQDTQDMEVLQESQKDLENTQKALQESQKDLEDAQMALQQSRKELENTQIVLHEHQKELEDAQMALMESQKKLEDAQIALQESQRNSEALQGQVKALQGVHDELLALRVSHAKLEGQADELRAAKVHTEGVLQEIISKIPQVPMLSDGQQKPSWWDRFRGLG